jgi:nucleoid-associated protein YgaU
LIDGVFNHCGWHFFAFEDVVEKGDTLAIISKKMYGDVSHVDAISRMNGLQNGNLIYIGQKLILP